MDWVTAWDQLSCFSCLFDENSLIHNSWEVILTRAGWEGVTNYENKWLLWLGIK